MNGIKFLKHITQTMLFAALILLVGCQRAGGYESQLSHTIVYPSAHTAPPITVRGIVKSQQSRNIYAMHGFRVDAVYVSVGDVVAKGDVLASLNLDDIMFAIQQQTAALSQARLNSQAALDNAQRMLAQATNHLNNNTNVMILHAQANLTAAQAQVVEAQRMHDIAVRDDADGRDMMVLNAESMLIAARRDMELAQDNFNRLQVMYQADFLSREDLRQAEHAAIAALNRYNDAAAAYQNADTVQTRTIEHTEILLDTAIAARNTAQTLLAAERLAAQNQLIDLQSAVEHAQRQTNVESLEIVLRQLERQLEEAHLTAPISGTVTAAHVNPGSLASGLIFTIEDVDDLRVMTSFREYDLPYVSEGMSVIITADGTGVMQHEGVIVRISPAAMPHMPIVAFETEVMVSSENTGLRIGMNARVTLVQ